MMFCPYPGSADFDQLVESGAHQIDEAAYYVGLSRGSSAHRSWNPTMSARRLRHLQLVMIAAFYLTSWLRRPRRFFGFLRAQLGGPEETYLDQMVRTKRRNLDPIPNTQGADRRAAGGTLDADESAAPTAGDDALVSSG
jgi:hypothetical protein